MKSAGYVGTALALGLSLAATTACADAAVAVSLWDKGPDSVVTDDATMAIMGKMDPANMSKGTMGLTLDQTSVAAGNVTFNVTNDSKDIIHELIVSPVAAGLTELAFLKVEMRVDEDTAGHLGEVSELDPGKTGTVTIALTAGTYILYCNIPAHFDDGMWTLLTVTP